MPVAYIDLPSGLKAGTKKKLVKDVADSIHHAYMIPDTRVFLREWPAEQTSVDGQIGAPMRPICDFVVPPGLPVEGKRQLVKQVEGKRRSRRKRRDEQSVASSPFALCDAAPSTPKISAGSRRWPATTANSRKASALGPTGRSSPPPKQLSCHRSAGALSGTQKSSYLGFFLRRCLKLFHRTLGSRRDPPSFTLRGPSYQAQ